VRQQNFFASSNFFYFETETAQAPHPHTMDYIWTRRPNQGILTEGEGYVQLTSSLIQVILEETKMIFSKFKVVYQGQLA
jgi:hypothetical protein